ncbi:MAG: lysozyme [Candidatus Ratteibacteria bacterium]|nr:lysozyme [Candidatus Cloacimonadota bacterium]
MIKELENMLKKHEGLVLKPYKCSAGKLTIGYGRNLEARGISEAEASMMLTNDIRDCMDSLDRQMSWWKEQPKAIQYVLVDMCFNLGIGGLLGFKKTLRFLQNGEYVKASEEMLDSLWAKQVGKRAIELSKMVAHEKKKENI